MKDIIFPTQNDKDDLDRFAGSKDIYLAKLKKKETK